METPHVVAYSFERTSVEIRLDFHFAGIPPRPNTPIANAQTSKLPAAGTLDRSCLLRRKNLWHSWGTALRIRTVTRFEMKADWANGL
jgi:hypothetical protein